MADIRINSLTTTASSTASDDFIAVDGATNGTRKLNAYSPSFGGNATVAGTLAVTKSNGGNTTGAANAAISLPTDESTIQGPGTYTQIRMGGNLVLGSSNETLIQVNQVNAIRINSSQQVQVPTTTASTSTSTGALVVSGGVGVAGAINAGGDSIINGTLTSNKNIGAGSLTAGSASNLIETSKVLSSNVLNSSIVMIAVSGSNGSDGGYCGYYMLNLVRQFGTYSVTVISSALPHNASSSYSFTWSLDANYLKVTAGKTTGLNYNYFTLTGSQTA